MSSRCSSSTCLNGNCQGCRNGSKYCNDPRCYPNCPDCSGETSINSISKRSTWQWILLVIITVLAVFLLILIVWGMYSSSDKDDSVQDQDQGVYYPQDYYQYQQQYQQPQYQEQQLEQAPPSISTYRPYEREIDASLDVDSAGSDIPMTTMLPDVSSVDLSNLSTPTVSSAKPAPMRQINVPDTKIRGF